MSTFAEFVLVAILIYLWESTLWMPLRGVVLRRRRKSNHWKIIRPGNLIATREVGLVVLLPFPPDTGLAPCQSPPLLVDADGSFLLETPDGRIVPLGSVSWEDLKEEQHHFRVGDHRTRVSSPRYTGFLRRAKQRGSNLETAVHLAMRLSLSPARAEREWRRWKMVSSPLRFYGTALAFGAFIGLPLVYLKLGNLQTLFLAAWLWCLMAMIAAHLWWLGSRVYPDARSALRTDALLSLLVPFHAMRAGEIAAVHAMGSTHPVGLIVATNDIGNPWLAGFVRRVLYPAPGIAGEHQFSRALRPLLISCLKTTGKHLEDFDSAPDPSSDPAASNYCPRCHGMFLSGILSCSDCGDTLLKPLPN